MANVQLYAGLALILFGFGSFAVFPVSQNSLCVQSVIQLTPQSTICPSSQSYIDSMLMTTSTSSNSGIWGSNTNQPSSAVPLGAGTFVKVYYVLGSGLTLSKYSLKFGGGQIFIPMLGVIIGTDNYATWFGAPVPSSVSSQLSVPVDFRGSLVDNLGSNLTLDAWYTFVPSSYVVTFTASDVTTGALIPLPGVQVNVFDSLGNPIGNADTDAQGKASLTLAYGTYGVTVYAPTGYGVASAPYAGCQNSFSTAVFFTFTTGQKNAFSFSFAQTNVNQCNTTVTVSNTAITVYPNVTITSQTVTLSSTSTTCIPPAGKITYTCVSNTGGGGSIKNSTGLIIGVPSLLLGAILVARGVRRKH